MKLKNIFKGFNKVEKSFYGFQYNPVKEYSLDWKSKEYLRAYEASPYVYACVKVRGEKVGQIDFVLKNKKDEKVEDNDLLKLLNKPNPEMSKSEFFEMYQTFKDLMGSAYIYLLSAGPGKKIEELHILRPDWVKIITSKETGNVIGYKYKTPWGKELDIQAGNVIASHYPNPVDQSGGLSPLRAAAYSVDTEEQIAKYQYNVLKNGGKIEGILNYKSEHLTREQINEIKDTFAEQYAGAKNSGKPLVTYGGAEYQNLGLTPNELSLIESKKMTRDDILLIYRTPKVIVAQTDGVNYANAKIGKSIFLSETIKPLMDNLIDKLNNFLIPEEFILSFVDPTPEDIELKLKTVESGSKNHYMTINEQREIMKLEPIDDGDIILIPFNLVELGGEQPNEKLFKKKSLKHPLADPEFRKKYHANWIKIATKREKVFARELKRFYKKQGARIIERLEAGLAKEYAEDFLQMEVEKELAVKMSLPLIEQMLKDAGQEAIFFVGEDKPFLTGVNIQQWIQARAESFADQTIDTTFKKLDVQFAESLAENETRTQLTDRIRNVYKPNGKVLSDARTQVIARTEVHGASQKGTFEGYKQAGAEMKIWTWAPGIMGGVRDEHMAMDGEERPMDMSFSNGLMFPGEGPASETINCLCTI